MIILGADHAGFELKNKIKEYLFLQNIKFKDLSHEKIEKDDYPDIAKKVCKEINSKNKGILICGSGIGMSISANRFKNIRAALCRSKEEAELSRKHNNSNILCLGQQFNQKNYKKIIDIWLETKFEKGRHLIRIKKIDK